MKTKQCFAVLIAIIGLLGATNKVHAVAYTFTNSNGSWNVAANWSPNGIPGTLAADTVTIPTAKTITGLGGTTVSIASLTIQGTGILNIDSSSTLNVSGALTMGNSGSGTCYLTNNGTLNLTGTGAGILNMAPASNPSGVILTNTAGSIFTCAGGCQSGNANIIWTFGNNGTATFTGAAKPFNTGFNKAAVINGPNGVLNLNNSVDPFGNSATLNATAVGNAVNYGFAGAQNAGSQNGPAVYYNLTLSGSGAKSLAFNTTVNGTLSLQGTATATSQTVVYGAGATLEYKGSAAQTATGNEFPTSANLANVIIDNPAGVSLAALSRTINGTLSLKSGALSRTSGGVTMGNGTTISRAAGNLSSLTPTFGATVNVAYNHTSATTTGTELPTSASVLNNLTLSNLAGVNLNANATVNGTFTALYASGSPAMAVGTRTLTLGSAPIALHVSGAPLAPGNYTIVSKTSGGVTATPGTLTINGSSAPFPAPYTGATISAATGELIVTVPSSSLPTSVAVTSSANPAGYLSEVELVAEVSPSTATGTVQFKTNGVAFGAPIALADDGKATNSTSALLRGTHVVTAEYSGDDDHEVSTGTLSPNQVITNHPPVASHLTLGVAHGDSATLLVIGGKHAPTDVDGDSLEITAAGTASSGTAGFTATSVTYLADGTQGTNNFTYTVSDGFGGTAIRTVTVLVYAAQGFNRLSPPDIIGPGTVALSYLGIPGQKYALDHATSLAPPIGWSAVITNTAADNGRLNFTNSSGAAENYFRTRHVP